MTFCSRMGPCDPGTSVSTEVLVGTEVTGGAAAAGDVRWIVSGPADAVGVVVAGASFSGTHRVAPQETLVRQLHRAGLAVLWVDLLGPALDGRPHRLDVPWCGDRLTAAVGSTPSRSHDHQRPIGLLGDSWTAAAALWAAADLGGLASAVVCWSARPEWPGSRLAGVSAATLFVVPMGTAMVWSATWRLRVRCAARPTFASSAECAGGASPVGGPPRHADPDYDRVGHGG